MFTNGQQSISGVSINNAPIGNITPSTGSFTALNASALNTTPIGTVTPASARFTNSRVNVVTVATLPAGVTGMTSAVNDALAPVALAAVAGGGAVTVSVFYNGAQWIVQ